MPIFHQPPVLDILDQQRRQNSLRFQHDLSRLNPRLVTALKPAVAQYMPPPTQQFNSPSNDSLPTSNTQVASPTGVLDSNTSWSQIDPSKLTEDERTELRHALLEQINARVQQYSKKATLYAWLYYIFISVSVIASGIVLILSSTAWSSLNGIVVTNNTSTPSTASTGSGSASGGDPTSTTSSTASNDQWRAITLTIMSALSTGALTLNTQLQTRVNAIYFKECVQQYQSLQLKTWIDMSATLSAFELLEQTYSDSGMGGLVALNGVCGSSSGKNTQQQASMIEMAPLQKKTVSSMQMMERGVNGKLN